MVGLTDIWHTMTGAVHNGLLTVFGSSNERELDVLAPTIDKINSLESHLTSLSDDDLKSKTGEFRERIQTIYDKVKYDTKSTKQKVEIRQKVFDHFLPEAYAVVRETAKRTIGQRHYDVQLIGGMVLHQGKIAEMVTGEGKTLAATLPAYLNALMGDPVHVITVNDYLADRDKDLMKPVYEFLGLTVGTVKQDSSELEKKEAYNCDITYGTGNTFAFDFLRDNMALSVDEQVQRGFAFAVVDEVDSLLIDEARTPLIISGQTDTPVEGYYNALEAANILKEGGDYTVDKKKHTIVLTSDGTLKAERKLSDLVNEEVEFHNPEQAVMEHQVLQSLYAKELYNEDKDYVVYDDEIVIIDEQTGRKQPGRRWSEGLHQAVEARHLRDGVRVKSENRTIAQIAFQNFFGLYDKLSGMTGTAMTDAAEFNKTYNLEVVEIPTNKPLIRKEQLDEVYLTAKEKWEAVVKDVQQSYEKRRPILIGTKSVEASENLSGMLKELKIPHNVLNAKNHEEEGKIIADAGKKGAVTVATNMAGRGTDIELGGKKPEGSEALEKWQTEHDEIIELGGLYILGTERHHSRRVDNQLRGRGGRQGDPGESRFKVSLEDDIIKIFGGEMVKKVFRRLGEYGESIESGQVTRLIKDSQKRVESMHFDGRKSLKEFSDVLEGHRAATYSLRQSLLTSTEYNQDKTLDRLWDGVVSTVKILSEESNVDYDRLSEWANVVLDADVTAEVLESEEDVAKFLYIKVHDAYVKRVKRLGSEVMGGVERKAMLNAIDVSWQEHLTEMGKLKDIIYMTQKNSTIPPKRRYGDDGNLMYQKMWDRINAGFLDSVL
ncbi:MAG: preprotein translocase subunit SecA [Nanoarchaeota archaeon]|nr:preprotein translocase subunit SecA [Nanoarchaeota archaeon]